MKKLVMLAFIAISSSATPNASAIDTVVAHPPVDAFFSCSEHSDGQFKSVGDALGTDCVVKSLYEIEGRLWWREYLGNGSKNEDWFGWHIELLSPCDCKIVTIDINPVTNEPGITGEGRASSITFLRSDGVRFRYAHVRDVRVRLGEEVKEGSPVAMVGNNGFSRNPHVYIAAWQNSVPLQLRWNQSKKRLPPEHRKQSRDNGRDS